MKEAIAVIDTVVNGDVKELSVEEKDLVVKAEEVREEVKKLEFSSDCDRFICYDLDE